MIETFEKFVKLVKKLDDYYILAQDKERLIIGTKVVVRDDTPKVKPYSFFEYIPQNNAFHKYEKLLPVFFLVTISQEHTDIDKLFIKNGLHILSIISKKSIGNLESIGDLFDNFVDKNFECTRGDK